MKPFTKKLSEVKIVLSPSAGEYKVIRDRYEEVYGTTDTYAHPEAWERISNQYKKTVVLANVSMKEAEAFAEPIRIMCPDQHVNLYGSDGSLIGNVTWNDQLKMFWGYPTYTEIGKAIMAKRTEEQAALGIQPSWE
jgi:hypothetical protein